ncbi:MAG: hemerythrin domain-containing protein [Catalinimonas sp.]
MNSFPSDQPLGLLVAERPARAAALHQQGIPFQQHREQTLADVCRHRGLELAGVRKRLGRHRRHQTRHDLMWLGCPLDVIVGYLRHTHRHYLSERLPFLQQLLKNTPAHHFADPAVGHDLKLIFPLFADDFIHHIHEEEDVLFSYATRLQRAVDGQIRPGTAAWALLCRDLNRYSIQHFAVEHADDDDDMAGIYALTDGYTLRPGDDLTVRVIYDELRDFGEDLTRHAVIENQIVFPYALQLEQQVRRRAQHLVDLN